MCEARGNARDACERSGAHGGGALDDRSVAKFGVMQCAAVANTFCRTMNAVQAASNIF
jgi:hypothetical protein